MFLISKQIIWFQYIMFVAEILNNKYQYHEYNLLHVQVGVKVSHCKPSFVNIDHS